jgi:hypothetical protein
VADKLDLKTLMACEDVTALKAWKQTVEHLVEVWLVATWRLLALGSCSS